MRVVTVVAACLLCVVAWSRSGVLAQAACSTAPATVDAIQAAETACGTARLDILVRGDSFHAGSESFCVGSCIEAINALMRTYPRNGSCDDDETFRIHQRIQTEQRECNPPSDECVSVYFEYLFFLQSTEGQQCLADVNAARALVAPNNQAAYDSVCTSTCYAQLLDFATRLQRADCGPWAVYLELRRDLDLLCSKVDDTYCEPEYLASADEIAAAMDSNRSSTTRSATLNTLCTPCFEHVQSIEGQYKASLGYENGEGNLCTRAGDTFCLPVLDDIEDTAAAEPTDDEQVNLRAQLVCADATTERCAHKMWAYEASQPTTTAARRDELNTYLKFSCLRHQTTDNVCANLVDDVVEGFYLEAVSSGQCEPEQVDGTCASPSRCTTWDDESQCPFGCTSAVNEIVDDLGCCFRAMKAMHTALTSDPDTTAALFARLSFLSDSCCARQRSACQTTFASACNHRDQTETLSVTISSPPLDWIRDNEEVFMAAFTTDIARTLGLLKSVITITTYREVTQGVTVSFDVAAGTRAQLQAIESELTDVIARDGLLAWTTTAQYAQRCNGSCTSSGAHAIASAATVLLLLIVHFLLF